MKEQLASIEQFVVIKTKIKGSQDPIETTEYTSVDDLFKSHLHETFNDPAKLRQYGIDVYRIRIGDKIKIFPSKWSIQFCKEKSITLSEDYNFSYEVINISIEYYSSNPSNDSGFPLIEMTIELRKI